MSVIHKTYNRVQRTFSGYMALGAMVLSLFTIIFMTPITREQKLTGNMGLRMNIAHADEPTSDSSGAHGSFSESDSSGAADGSGSDSGCDGGSDGGSDGGCDGGCD
jgi:hypothetical protein